jgi:diacylglycerol O-acyltransferase / wax synthase
VQQLSFMDQAFLLGEAPRVPGHFAPVLIYDPATAPGGTVTFEDILESIRARLPLDRTFRRKLARVPMGLDHAYWIEDPDFDLEFHVRQTALPGPGDWRQFCNLVARLHARPLDMTRPLWELTVIEGIESVDGLPKGAFALVLKVHHAAIDGASGVQMISVIHEDSADAGTTSVADDWRPEQPPSAAWMLGRAAVNTVRRPVEAARAVGGRTGVVGEAARVLTHRPRMPQRLPRTRFNGKLTPHRVFDAFRFPIEDLKRIKARVEGATINDAALAMVAGGLRSYLQEKGELPEEALVAAVPVSTRTPEQAADGGNAISMLRASLHTDVADPITRLTAIRDSTRTSKEAQKGVGAAVLQDVAQAVPGALMGIGMRAMAALPVDGPILAHTGVTNVPGPREPLYFCGAQLEWFTGCSPLWDGLTLMHSIGSYREDFSVQITADRAAMPDPDVYLDHLRAALAELVP